MTRPVITRDPDGNSLFQVAFPDYIFRFLSFEDAKAAAKLDDADAASELLYGPPEPPTCSLCDGVGHGYPGAGPCPLEERGYWDAEEDIRRYGAF
jgi:hypothetical protein